MDSLITRFFKNLDSKDSLRIHFKDQTFDKNYISKAIFSIYSDLKASNISQGQRVVVSFNNTPEAFFSFYAVLAAKAIPVLVDRSMKQELFDEFIKNEDAVLTDRDSVNHKNIVSTKPIDIQAINLDQFSEFLSKQISAEEVGNEDTVYITHTSGTTGLPKKVLYSENNMFWATKEYSKIYQLDKNNVFALFLPFHYCLGTIANCITPMEFQKEVFIAGLDMNMEEKVKYIEKYKVNVLTVFPNFYRDLLNVNTDNISFSNLRICDSGGEILPVAIINKFREKSDVLITEGYGQTETVSLTHFLLQDSKGKYRLGSVGRPCDGVECRIVDENMKEVNAGEIGQLLVRGPMLMKKYDSDEITKESLYEGSWFKTGDIFYKDTEDFYYLLSRKKDLGDQKMDLGFQLRELEEVIYSDERVKEGTYLVNNDASITLIIVPKSNVTNNKLEDLKDSLMDVARKKECNVSRVVLTDLLPRTITGKVKKFELNNK